MNIPFEGRVALRFPVAGVALLLGVLTTSCSTTHHLVSPDAEELPRHVLVLTETNGQVTHQWRRAEDFDLKPYRVFPRSPAQTDGRIVLVAGRQRDCDEENRECVRKCMSRPLARGFGHITSGGRKLGGKKQYCETECWQSYQDCLELQGRVPQEFSASEEAAVWLKEYYKTLVVGGVFVIAGVVFVTVSAGAGAVVLVPALILSP